MKAQEPTTYLGLIRVISALVPASSRQDWRQEWEAEVIARWQQLEKWGQLNLKTKLDLTRKVSGATLDAVSFQQTSSLLALVILNLLVALLTGFGAVQEFVMRGILDHELQPLLLSAVAIFVSILFIVSALALFRQWRTTRPLIIATGILSILLHVYGSLPPHRTMGYLALIIGAGYGAVLLLFYEWNTRRDVTA